MNKNYRYIIVIIVVLLLGIGAYYFGYLQGNNTNTVTNEITPAANEQESNPQVPDEEKILADIGYFCDGGKTVHAVYFEDKLIIELSDGRAAQLHNAGTAAGDFYTNADGSIAFANQGFAAFVEEDGEITYANCVELDTEGVEAN